MTDSAVPHEKRRYYFPHSTVVVPDFPAEGLILDVGGGGEGVVGRIKGRQVIAIDRSREELVDAPAGPLKIVMDATDQRFLDESFDTATLFYTLLFVPGPSHAALFGELFRVLRPGGRLWLWNSVIPLKPADAAGEQDIAVFPFTFALPADTVETAFGTRWPSENRDENYYLALAGRAGFRALENRREGHNFFLLLEKPQT